MIAIKNASGEVIFELDVDTLAGINFCNTNLQGASLEGADLQEANFCNTNLYNANLEGADLQEANLYNANLEGADLQHANLQGANLEHANLQGANLYNANLEWADLYKANLYNANLQGANLNYANLQNANLYNANLEGANLNYANLQGAKIDGKWLAQFDIIPEGEFIAYKKTMEGVVTLRIPKEARRSNATSRKCRAEFAIPIEMPEGITECTSWHDEDFKYRLNEIARCHEWQENRWIECGGGIHFFLTRQEAEDFTL